MTQLTCLNTSLKIDSFSDPDKVARDLTVKTRVHYNIDPLENVDLVADPLAVFFFFQFFIFIVTWCYVHKLVYICK